MITYTPTSPPRKHPIGCFSKFIVLVGIATCIWLTYISGFGTALLQNKPLISIPLPFSSAGASAHQPLEHYQVTGKPSLSAVFINRVLAQAHSPAMETGQALYALSLTYGIDDAYAVAFFQHESQFGTTGTARITRSIGNIRCSQGYICYQGYRAYTTWQQGEQDWYRLIRNQYINRWHFTTLAQIIPVYAPATDGNDVAAYIAAVEHDVNQWQGGQA